jgi:hypothetical protein
MAQEVATTVIKARLVLLHTSEINWARAVKAAERRSHAEIAHACEQAAKNAILEHTTSMRDELVQALEERRAAHA